MAPRGERVRVLAGKRDYDLLSVLESLIRGKYPRDDQYWQLDQARSSVPAALSYLKDDPRAIPLLREAIEQSPNLGIEGASARQAAQEAVRASIAEKIEPLYGVIVQTMFSTQDKGFCQWLLDAIAHSKETWFIPTVDNVLSTRPDIVGEDQQWRAGLEQGLSELRGVEEVKRGNRTSEPPVAGHHGNPPTDVGHAPAATSSSEPHDAHDSRRETGGLGTARMLALALVVVGVLVAIVVAARRNRASP